jgi:hypothetical protein
MEPEKLEEYKDATGIALLNAYSSGILTREEYKLIQRFKKEGINDVIAFLKGISEEESPEGTKNASSFFVPSIAQKEGAKNVYSTYVEGTKNVPLEDTKSAPSRGTKIVESTFFDDSTKNVPSIAQLSEFSAKEDTKIVDSTENLESTESIISFSSSRNVVKTDSYRDTSDLASDLSMVNIRSNFTKLDNNVSDYLNPLQTTTEQSIYNRLYRLSVGWGKNYCRVKSSSLMTACNIKDSRTLNAAIDGLITKGHIQLVNRNNKGSLYRVLFPGEILENCKTASIKSSFSNNEGTKNVDSTKIVPSSSKDIFKDNIKDTLSQEEIIDYFYSHIDQKSVTNKKRERANNCLQGLLNEGYSLEDIKFAAEWTVKNTEKKLYDFSIIEHTISQAMSKKEEIEKREAEKLEKERLSLEEKEEAERLEKESALMEFHKAQMSQKDRDELRKQALEEIGNTKGIKAEFITDILINTKENEILKRELDNSQ